MKTSTIKGFTLLEVMIALAILAGVSASVVQIFASGVEVTQSVEMESQAYILAESKMDEILLMENIQDSEGSDTIQNTPFRYLIEVSPHSYPGEPRGFELWHINLSVLWGEGDYQSSVKLESLKSQVRQ